MKASVGGPKVLVSILTHGNERIGVAVREQLEKLTIKKGSLTFLVGNPEAAKANKRFIEKDLNRIFPGTDGESVEHRRAREIVPIVAAADLVIDIHSTKSGLKDALIVTKYDDATEELIDVIRPKNLLVMHVTNQTALITGAKIGIAFEYGKDRSVRAIRETVEDITRLLVYLGMVEGEYRPRLRKTTKYDVLQKFMKPEGAKLASHVENYKMVRRGGLVGYCVDGKRIYAEESFYPILFGENSYLDFFGFIAKKRC